MNKFSAKNKIILASVIWVILCVAMIMYGFDIFAKSNQHLIFSIQESKKELASLEAEKNSYTQAQKELDQILKEKNQPQDFFSQDISLVEELKILESLQDVLDVKLTVAGVSGTTKTAAKAKTTSDIVYIPYSISASGPYENIVKLAQVLENLPFITTINSLSLSVADKGNVNYSVSANFYIRRK